MNFSEFKKLLGADPWAKEPETRRARSSSPEFEQAAGEAEAFERKLRGAVLIDAPEGLLDSIRAISEAPATRRRRWPLALAASLVVAVGAAGLVWKQSRQWDSVEAYVVDHYGHDGASLVSKAVSPVPEFEVNRILASVDASAQGAFSSSVRFIKYCPTPEGRGVHMVVSTPQGLMTVIYMPKAQVADGEMFDFQPMRALLVDFDQGSAAVIGEHAEAVEALGLLVREGIRTGLVDA